jgi:predicted permease
MIGTGIGATTTIFSVADHVLLRPLPYLDPDELVTIRKGSSGVPIPDFVDIRDRTRCFESLGGQWDRMQDLTGTGQPERVNVGQLTGDFLHLLGAMPSLGRLFIPADFAPDAGRVAVLSHQFWQRRMGGATEAVGQAITLEGQRYEVVGVVSRDFTQPEALTESNVDVWVPLDLTTPFLLQRTSYLLNVVARLAPALTAAAAQRELDALAAALATEHPDGNRRQDGSPVRFPLRSLHEATVGDVGDTLSLLLGAVGLMLLIACANVANLSLARAADRSREMALRTALGAGRGRIVRLVLMESVVLGLIGGGLGVAIAAIGVKTFAVLNAGGIPRVASVTVDWRVVAFALLLSIAAGVLFGLLPAIRSAESDYSIALKEGSQTSTLSRSGSRTRNTLVVSEIALALVLLVGAGLLFNSFMQLRRVDPGFDTENVLALPLRFGLPFGWGGTRYADADTKAAFAREILAAARAIPGVIEAGGGLSPPFNRVCCWSAGIVRSDEPDDTVESWIRPVTHRYLEAIGARLIAGRTFTAVDDQGERFIAVAERSNELRVTHLSAVVNASLAARLFPNESPLGREIVQGGLRAEVVGVVRDISHLGLDRSGEYDLYVPFLRTGTAFDRLDLAVRYRGSTEVVADALRRAVWNIDPDLPIGTMQTMDQRMSRSLATPRFYSALFASFAILAFLLAASGIYASMAYVVRQRRRELGIRLALGGAPANLVWMVLGRGTLQTAVGLTLGLAGAYALSRLLSGFVFGISTSDPLTFVSASLVLGAVALLACVVPARKAAGADPLEVLRTQ